MRVWTSSGGRSSRGLGLVALGLSAVLFACSTSSDKDPPTTVRSFVGTDTSRSAVTMRMCADQAMGFTTPAKKQAFIDDCMRRIRVALALSGEGTRMDSMHWLIPEFHDEQRFAERATGKFGPVANIFASPALGGFQHDGQLLEHDALGMIAAVIFIDTTDGAAMPSEYRRLGLEPGVNCLWISLQRGRRNPWQARMTSAKAGSPCNRDDVSARPLAVRRTTAYPGIGILTSADIPPVARFTWDTQRRPLLGVRCLIGWCDIGPARGEGAPDFTPLNLVASLTEFAGNRAALIPAWHDQQTLANYGTDGEVVPGTVDATIIPLNTEYTSPASFSTPQRVAIVYLHTDPAGTPYADVWGMKAGANVVSLQGGTVPWAASVTEPGGTSRPWSNVHRHMHYDIAVIPTARFRWASADDGIWVGCGQACCRMEGDS